MVGYEIVGDGDFEPGIPGAGVIGDVVVVEPDGSGLVHAAEGQEELSVGANGGRGGEANAIPAGAIELRMSLVFPELVNADELPWAVVKSLGMPVLALACFLRIQCESGLEWQIHHRLV